MAAATRPPIAGRCGPRVAQITRATPAAANHLSDDSRANRTCSLPRQVADVGPPGTAIEFMDACDIAAQIFSVPIPLTDDHRTRGRVRPVARIINEEFAGIIASYPETPRCVRNDPD